MVTSKQKGDAQVAIQACVVSLIDSDGGHCGHGFLTDPTTILTCAHVIAVALRDTSIKYQGSAPAGPIKVRFPFLSDAPIAEGQVTHWIPASRDSQSVQPEDIAVLKLASPCSIKCQPQPATQAQGMAGESFYVLGENRNTGSKDAVSGTLTGGGGASLLQLDPHSGQNTSTIDNGFSGTPVWNIDRNGIVGVMAKTEFGSFGYCIPTEALRQCFPGLQVRIHEPTHVTDYRTKFRIAVDDPLSPCPDPPSKYDIQIHTAGNDVHPADHVYQWMKANAHKFAILVGSAGGGKSYVFGRVVRQLLDPEHRVVPVYIKLKSWKDTDTQSLTALRQALPYDFGALADVVFRGEKSLAPMSSALLSEFLSTCDVLIILDGLNEIAQSGLREDLLNVFDGFQQSLLTARHSTYILVSDRRKHGHRSAYGPQISLLRLAAAEIRRVVDQEKGFGTFEKLKPASRQILDLPYFLNAALKGDAVHSDSYSELIAKFLENFVPLTQEESERISTASYQAYVDTYKNAEALSFKREAFELHVGKDVTQRLIEARVLEEVNGERLQFDHQLKHDYFAALHLSSNSPLWGIDTFDAVSRDYGSAQVHNLVLELLPPNSDQIDKYGERVYDWNWHTAIDCILGTHRLGMKRWSHEMEVAIVAQVAEKRFDPVLHTAKRSRTALHNFPPGWAQPFTTAQSLADLANAANSVNSTVAWFQTWKFYFTLLTPSEEHATGLLQELVSTMSLLGWCSANVFRRYSIINPGVLETLRSLYYKHLATSGADRTIRWRVVHALGRFPELQNAQLLQTACTSDAYPWVRYGAARSLVEMAAISADVELRSEISKFLTELIPYMDKTVRGEIGRAVFHRDYSGDWIPTAERLLLKIREFATDDDRSQCDKRIQRLTKDDWRQEAT